MTTPEDMDRIAAEQERHAAEEQLYDCAKQIAIAAARKSGDALTAGHEYLAGRFEDGWEPHAWVIDAVVQGLRIGGVPDLARRIVE